MIEYPKIGEIWRKCGPADWLKVVAIQLPGYSNYDGGMPGVSVVSSTCAGKWRKNRWFWPCQDYESFKRDMAANGRKMKEEGE